MASTNKTPKLGLSQYEGGDKPSWLGDYNADMAAIDEKTLDSATYDPLGVKLSAFEAENHKMAGYSKATQATPIVATDSTMVAIGKLEKTSDGKGDMSKSVYDADNDGKVDKAKLADEAVSIDWAGVKNRPSSLPNPNAVTLQQSGVTSATYDGVTAQTFNVTPDGIGAAKLTDGKVDHTQLPINDTTTSTSVREVGSANAVRLAKTEAITESGTQADTKISEAIKVAAPEILYTNAGLSDVANIKQGLDKLSNLALIANRIYPGVDLSVVFAAEIAGHSDVWAWIKARTQSANFTGIYVGDYIPFIAGGNTIKAEIAGIDTYYKYGDPAVSHHIDFISRDCWPDTHVWNKVNYNNGLAASPSPWMCSDIYAWLNSLSMSVPNAATANPATVAVNYSATGVYDKLPTALKDVIIQKRVLAPSRFTAGNLLIDDNGWDWQDIGKLWLPSEVEVYGYSMWGSILSPYQGYSVGGYVQYPVFAQNMKRIKGAGNDGARSPWWLSSARGGGPSGCAIVIGGGCADNNGTSNTGNRAPLCFRIA